MALNKIWIKNNNLWELTSSNQSGLNHSEKDENKEINNLLLLENTNSPEILFHLKKRFHQLSIYTYAGKILIAINPFQSSNLYSSETQQKFIEKLNNQSVSNKEPHLYELANDAIISANKNISFLISGESGSGKTESTKKLLDYFAINFKDVNDILPKILEFNCILEAFGNATTSRNHNSSRFGKFISININNNHEISAKIKTYLLEKIRVVSQSLCNYHIFYSFGYGINCPDWLNKSREDWDADYLKKDNLEYIWKRNELGDNLWNDLCKIINLLISLLENKLNEDFLKENFNNLSMEDFNKIFAFKTIKTAEEIIKTPLTPQESLNIKQTVMMTIYDKLFDRIVELVNDRLGRSMEVKRSFGILDIFGFEVFKINNFEQLCINYTNERLQSIFNKYVFEEEIKMFEEEGILKSRVSFENNNHIIDFFDKKPDGFFPLLDEKSILGSSDKELSLSLPKNKVIKMIPDKFIITHYAENVEYTWGDFTNMNVEKANSDIQEFLYKFYGNFEIFSGMMQIKSKKRGSIGTVTVTSQFRQNLNSLINELSCSELYFIRCIKPNDENRSNIWDEEKVEKQLSYCGITSAIELARQTFPVRMDKNSFLEKYEAVYLRENMSKGEWMEKIDKEILVGKTKVFFTNEKLAYFNKLLIDAQKELIMNLVRIVKGALIRRRVVEMGKNVMIIANMYRVHLARRELSVRKNALKIQRVWRSHLGRRIFRERLSAILFMQRRWRTKTAKKKSRKLLASALICLFMRRNYVNWVIRERNSMERRVEIARREVSSQYENEINNLKSEINFLKMENNNLKIKNSDLEKYENMYNDLNKIIDNKSNIEIEKSFFTPITSMFSSFNTQNVDHDKYNNLWNNFQSMQAEYRRYQEDMKEMQLLMGQKLHGLYMENIKLQEENINLVREMTGSGRKWYEKFFY